MGIAAFGRLTLRRGVPDQERRDEQGARAAARTLIELVHDHAELRAFFVANALWELALAALKTFVILYITKSLGKPVSAASSSSAPWL